MRRWHLRRATRRETLCPSSCWRWALTTQPRWWRAPRTPTGCRPQPLRTCHRCHWHPPTTREHSTATAVAAADSVAAEEAVAAPEGVRAADCAAGALPLTVPVEHGEGETLALPLLLGGAEAEAEAEALPP